MKDLKISNELLNLVTGCKCEFNKIESNFIDFIIISGEIKEDISSYFYKGYDTHGINLHTFIHIAKIKAFDNHYDIKESVYSCIYYPACKYSRQPSERIKAFKGEGYFDVNATIEALEWVAEKLGKK